MVHSAYCVQGILAERLAASERSLAGKGRVYAKELAWEVFWKNTAI